ncbi:trimethylamine methyltransferase family protein [bacterium]|nr:trimethylamine methyltransferase family protein [bacterium]
MTKCVPNLQPLLSQDQIQQMHQSALEILATAGIKIEHPRLIQMLTGQDGITIEDGWARLRPDVVDRYVNEQRQRARPFFHPKTSEIHCSAGGYASYTVDMETDEVRPITTTDLIQYTKLIHAMNDAGYPISGSCPGFPQDVPPPMRPLAQYKIGAEYSKFGGSADIPSIPIAEYIREMQQVMGRLLRSSQPSASFSLPLYMVSPLRLQGDSLERILHFWDELSSISVSSMPMIGVSLPIFFPDAFVLAMAEVMGGYTILKLMGAANVSFSVNAHPFDMKYTTLTFASPEHNLCDLTQMEINRFYGISNPGSRSLRTMAKRPGIQAAAEKAASAIIGALAGSRSFSSGGVMALDELFSPEQLVIDCEIIAYVKRFIKGYEFSGLQMSIEDIREMSIRGNFLEHESTLKHYRDTYWMPQLFEHTMLKQWFEMGESDLRQRIKAIVHEMIQKHDFRLDESKQRQLNEIYEHAMLNLQ